MVILIGFGMEYPPYMGIMSSDMGACMKWGYLSGCTHGFYPTIGLGVVMCGKLMDKTKESRQVLE
jgi:hypothetical protein